MPDDRLEKARFVRVSKTGDLVFSLGGREMAVSVDDTLERAILEAKQVRSEMRQAPQPHQQSTLPISQIQSLYSRRCRSGPCRGEISSERNAGTSFLHGCGDRETVCHRTVPCRGGTQRQQGRALFSELVERTLASAGIGMESVTWKSTRRGLEPWRIVAIFTSAGREIHAEWTWNMHDNSVMSLDRRSKLLGDRIRNQPRIPNSSRRFPNCPATPYAPRVSSAPCLLGRLLRLRFRPHGLPQSGPLSLPQVPCPRWIYPRPSHRPRPRLMALRPPVRSLRRPPDLFRHLPQDYSNRLPRHQSRPRQCFGQDHTEWPQCTASSHRAGAGGRIRRHRT